MVLSNIPATVQVYAPVYPNEGNTRAQLYSADTNGAGGSPVTGSPISGVPYQQLTVSGGVATAAWVVLSAGSTQLDSYTFPLLLLNAGINDLNNLKVAGSLAVVSTVGVASATAPVPRYRDLRYAGFDEIGSPIDRTVKDFHARVVQHEVDHLDGILYPRRIRDLTQFGFNEALFPGEDVTDD